MMFMPAAFAVPREYSRVPYTSSWIRQPWMRVTAGAVCA